MTELLDQLAESRNEVRYDGQHVLLRPPTGGALSEELREAVIRWRPALVWLCLRRIRPDLTRPAWEFWLPGNLWLDFCGMKVRMGG